MEQTFLEEEKSKGFDIKGYLLKLVRNYYWFIIAIAVFGAAAYFYLHYSIPQYIVSTNVLVKQPNEAANKIGSVFEKTDNSADADKVKDVNSEIFKLKSSTTVGEAVDSVKLDILLSTKTESKNVPLNIETLPFYITVKKSNPENESPLYKLSLYKTSYRLENKSGTIEGSYNKPLLINSDTLLLQTKETFIPAAHAEYQLQYISRSHAIANYVSRLTVVPHPEGGAGMLQISLKDEIPRRARKSIEVLVHSFDMANLDYSNQALRKELNFLNSTLSNATTELDSQSRLVRDFKVSNKIYDISSSANQLLGSLPAIDSRKSDNILKGELLNLVESNIKSYNDKEDIVPTSSGLQDPVLSDQISKYNQLVLQKRTVLDNGTNLDPRLPSINGQLEQIRNNILKNVKNIRDEISANTTSLAVQEGSITGRFTAIPEKEKELIELNRVLSIKQMIYTSLLQKKEDKEMELAATQIANSRIIDNGLGGTTQYPPPLMIYAIAAAAGILLPSLIILLRVLTNNKIESRKDVETLTALPIAGQIANVQKGNVEIVITPGNVSSEAEQFRTLRTNIYYLAAGLKQKTLLITSSKSGEGKSFISLNLASSVAISNKRVALLEFDLRNIGLSQKLGIKNSVGLANYLMGEVDLEDIIQLTDYSENLFFISSGYPLPPNPGELILSDRMQKLFGHLKDNYDVVIIDTPPIGPVSDALTLAKWADRSFFVIRHKHTLRSTLSLVNKLNQEQKLPNLTLIINGIKDTKEFNYGNDFGYGYGYQPNNKKKKWDFIGN